MHAYMQVLRNNSRSRFGRNKSSVQEAVKRVPSGHNLSTTERSIRQVHAAEGGVQPVEQRGEPALLRLDAGSGGGQREDEGEVEGPLRAGAGQLPAGPGRGRPPRRTEHGAERPSLHCSHH